MCFCGDFGFCFGCLAACWFSFGRGNMLDCVYGVEDWFGVILGFSVGVLLSGWFGCLDLGLLW